MFGPRVRKIYRDYMLVITDKFRHLESIYNIKYWLNYFVSADTPKLEKIFKMMEENIIDMFSGLNKYTVKLSLFGVKREKDPNAKIDIEGELIYRPHILDFELSWDDETLPIMIEVTVEGKDEQGASNQIAEEIFEVACAVLKDVEGMRVWDNSNPKHGL